MFLLVSWATVTVRSVIKRLFHVAFFTAVFIETHRVGHMGAETWLLGNINQTGYFRVNYDLHNWRLLIQQLMSNPKVFLSSTSVSLSVFPFYLKCFFRPFCYDSSFYSPHHFLLYCKCLCCSLAADHLRGQQGRSDRWRLQPGKVGSVCYMQNHSESLRPEIHLTAFTPLQKPLDYSGLLCPAFYSHSNCHIISGGHSPTSEKA